MPNISFDIFFDKDFINVTATRAQGTPKVKPEWKVRTAPKLPPKEIAPAAKNAPRPPKIQGGRITELPPSKPGSNAAKSDDGQEAPKPKKNIPKLAPKAKATPQK